MKKVNLSVLISEQKISWEGDEVKEIKHYQYAFIFEQQTFSQIASELLRAGVCEPEISDLAEVDTELKTFCDHIDHCLKLGFSVSEVTSEIAGNIVLLQSMKENKKNLQIDYILNSPEMIALKERNEPEIVPENTVYSEDQDVSIKYYEAYNYVSNPFYDGSWDARKGAFEDDLHHFFLASKTTKDELHKKFTFVEDHEVTASHFDKDGNPDPSDYATYLGLTVEAKKMLKKALREKHLTQA